MTYINDLPPIRISFRNRVHYDSVVTDGHGQTVVNSDDAGIIEDAALVLLTNWIAWCEQQVKLGHPVIYILEGIHYTITLCLNSSLSVDDLNFAVPLFIF